MRIENSKFLEKYNLSPISNWNLYLEIKKNKLQTGCLIPD